MARRQDSFCNGDRGYNGVFLGWNGNTASYSITLPPEAHLTADDSALALSVAVTADGEDEGPTDFTVAAQSDNGVEVKLPLSRYRPLWPAVPVRFTKVEYLDKLLYKEPSEPVFQSVEIPLRDFAAVDARFDPKRLLSVRLIFDRTPASELLISQIGIERISGSLRE